MAQPARRQLLAATLLLAAGLAIVGCDGDSITGPRPEETMEWILTDDCNDGLGLQAVLFDYTNDLIFPGRNQVYSTGSGGSIDALIGCERGAEICYGAETDPASDIFWGVGLDGREDCPDCCERCSDIVVEFDLVCNAAATSARAIRRR